MPTNKQKNATTSKNRNVNTKWLNNAMKSIGVSASKSLSTVYPNLSDAVASTGKSTKTIINQFRSGQSNSNRVQGAVNNNKYVKSARRAFGNAIEDLKSGNFNNEDRMMDNMMGDMGEDDFDFSFGDEDIGGMEGSDEVTYVDASNDAGFASLSTQIQKNTESSLKAQQASMDATFAITSNSMIQIQNIGSEIINHLGNINSSLSAMVEYNNENVTKYIEASLSFFEHMGSKTENASSETSESDEISAATVYRGIGGSGGGLKIEEYKKYVKQQFKKSLGSSAGGMVNDLLSEDMLNMMADNPLGMLTEGFTKWMIPKVLGSTIQNVEHMYATMMPNILSRVADWGDEVGIGFTGKLKTFIGKTFGLRVDRKGKINAKIESGPVPFDGITKHAITEIIPKELREQTSYLKGIAKHFHVNTEKAKGDAEVFDYNDNKYIKVKDVQNNILRELQESILDSFKREDKDSGRDTFGSQLYKMLDSVENDKDRKTLETGIDEFLFNLSKSNRHIDPLDSDENSTYKTILNAGGSHKDVKKAIDEYIKSMATANPVAFYDISRSINSAKEDYTKKLKEIEADPNFYNLWASGLNGREDLDALLEKQFKYNANAKKQKLSHGYQNATIEEPENHIRGLSDMLFGNMGNRMQNAFNSITHGDSQTATREFMGMMTDQFKSVGAAINTHFLTPIKDAVFGEKDEQGNRKDGLFAGATNKANDFLAGIKYGITGKAYTDSKGITYEDTNDSMVGHFSNMGKAIKKGVMTKLFGEQEVDENGNPIEGSEKGSSFFSKIKESLKSGFQGWQEAFLGRELTEDDRKNMMESMKKGLREKMPSMLTGAGIGSGLSMLAGSSVLGTIIGGPLAGAALGAAGGFLAKNEKFQNFIFGEKDEDGNRLGGLISKKTQDFFKQNKSYLTGSAAIGGAAAALGIKSTGALGMLVGGPIAGSLLGLGTGILMKSKTFDRFLHGDPEKGQKGVLNAIRDAFNKNAKTNGPGASFDSAGKSLGMAGIGAGVGAVSMGMLSSMGILGVALGPLGPVGGALMGLGLSIKAQGKNFKSWLFGEDYEDPKTGEKKHKQGLVGQFGNMINANILRPMAHEASYLIKYTGHKIEHNLLDPFKFLSEDIASKAGEIVGNIKSSAAEMFNGVGSAIKKNAAEVLGTVFKPLGSAMAKGADIVVKTAINSALLPANIVKLGLNVVHSKISEVTAPIRGLIKDVRTAIFKGIKKVTGYALKAVGGVFKIATAPVRFVGGLLGTGVNKLSNAVNKRMEARGLSAISYGSDEGSIGERWRRAKKNAKIERAQMESEKKKWEEHDRNAKIIAKYTKNQYSADTEEARDALKRMNYRQWAKLSKIDAEDTERKKNEERAKVEKNGKGTAGMSSAQLAQANPSQLSEEGKQTYFLQGIFNLMRGKQWNGKDKNTEEGQNNETAEEIENRTHEEQTSTETTGTSDATVDTSEDNRDEQKEVADQASFRQYISNSFKELKNYFTGHDDETLEGDVVHNEGIFERAGNFLGKEFEDLKGFGKWWKSRRRETREKIEENRAINEREREHAKEERRKYRRLLRYGTENEGYADGTDNATPGLHPINEEGSPEIIITDGKPKTRMFEGGEKVLPTNKPLPVIIEDMSKKVADELNDQSDDDIRKNAEIDQKNLAKNALEKAIDRGTTKEERKAEIEAEEKRNYRATVVDSLKESASTAKEHLSNWLGIFSKKGLITGGLLLLAPFITKLFKLNWGEIAGNIGKLVSGIAGIASKIADFGLDTLTDLISQFLQTEKGKEREDGNSAGDQAVKNIEDIADGNIFTNEEGSATHQTDARVTFAGRTALNFMNSAHKTPFASKMATNQKKVFNKVKKAYAVSKNIGSKAKSGAASIKNSKIGQKVIGVADNAVTTVKNSKVVKGASTVKNSIKNVTKSGGEKFKLVLEKGKKNSKLFAKVSEIIEQFFEFITKRLSKGGKNVTSKIWKKINPKTIIGALSKQWDNVVEKIVKGFEKVGIKTTAGTVSFGLSEVVFSSLSAINGASGTAKLFQVDQDKVDGTMTFISTAIGAIAGTTIGGFVDVILQIAGDIIGVDILHAIAVTAYNHLKGEDSEDVKALEDAQAEFHQKYTDYQEDEKKKQYETQKKAGIIDNSVTYEEFSENKDGKYKVSYKSFQDYNTDQHKSLVDKGATVVGKTFKGIKRGIGNFINGKEELTDDKGNTYTKNADGTYDVKDKDGNSLGYVNKNAIPENTTKSTKGFSLKKAVSSAGATIANTAKSAGSAVKSVAKGAVSTVGGWFKKAGSFLSGKKEESKTEETKEDTSKGVSVFELNKGVIYRNTSDGTYYKKVGNQFNQYTRTGQLLKQGIGEATVRLLYISGVLVQEKEPSPVIMEKSSTSDKALQKMARELSEKVITNMKKSYDQTGKDIQKVVDNEKNSVDDIAKAIDKKVKDDTVFNYTISPGCYFKVEDGKYNLYNSNGTYMSSVNKSTFVNMLKNNQLIIGTMKNSKKISEDLKKLRTATTNMTKKVFVKATDTNKEIEKNSDARWENINKSNLIMGTVPNDWKLDLKNGEVMYLSNGKGYIKREGNTYSHYSILNSLIEKNLSKEDVYDLVSIGMSKDGKSERDVEGENAVKQMKTSVKEVWSSVKDVAKKGWESFKNFLKGGSGSGISGGYGNKASSLSSIISKQTKNNSILNTSDTSFSFTNTPSGGGFGTKSNIIPFRSRGGRGDESGDTVNGFTYYSQNDSRWKNKAYGNDSSTMGDSGCGPAAMSMVASQMTGKNVDPTSMAGFAEATGDRDETGTNWNFINKASVATGLSSRETINPTSQDISSELDNGNPMILSGVSGGHGQSAYTPAGHYVVAVGKDSNGNVKVNDPRGKSFSKTYNLNDLADETGAAWSFGGRGKKPKDVIKKATTPNKNKTPRDKAKDKKDDAEVVSNGAGFTAEDVVKVALNEVGYKEKASNANLDDKNANAGSNNYTKYARDVGHANGQYWCATFVSWCFYTAANKDKSKAETVMGPLGAYCPTIEGNFKARGAFDQNPKVGDVVLFNSSRDPGRACHIGIVIGVTNTEIITVEGNTSLSGFNDNGGAVAQKTYQISNTARIRGYGHPNYDGTSNFKGVTSSGSSSSSGGSSVASVESGVDFFSALSTIMGSLGTRVINGAMTGKYDTDFTSLFASNSSSDTGTSSGSDSSSSASYSSADDIKGSDTAEKVWNYFTSSGYSKEATAGIMGNMYAESGVNPTVLQNGHGPAAGIVQWEKYGDASTRWGSMAAHARSKGKEWTDLGSQLEFIDMELKAPGFKAFFQHTGNMSKAGTSPTTFDVWSKSTDVDTATRQFEGAFERAGVIAMTKRTDAAKRYYDLYKDKQTTNTDNKKSKKNKGGGKGTGKPATTKKKFEVIDGGKLAAPKEQTKDLVSINEKNEEVSSFEKTGFTNTKTISPSIIKKVKDVINKSAASISKSRKASISKSLQKQQELLAQKEADKAMQDAIYADNLDDYGDNVVSIDTNGGIIHPVYNQDFSITKVNNPDTIETDEGNSTSDFIAQYNTSNSGVQDTNNVYYAKMVELLSEIAHHTGVSNDKLQEILSNHSVIESQTVQQTKTNTDTKIITPSNTNASLKRERKSTNKTNSQLRNEQIAYRIARGS